MCVNTLLTYSYLLYSQLSFCFLWLKSYVLRLLADVQDTFMTYEIYDDIITIRLVQEACKMLGESNFNPVPKVLNYLSLTC